MHKHTHMDKEANVRVHARTHSVVQLDRVSATDEIKINILGECYYGAFSTHYHYQRHEISSISHLILPA